MATPKSQQYWVGWGARCDGIPRNQNPYRAAHSRQDWYNGWEAAGVDHQFTPQLPPPPATSPPQSLGVGQLPTGYEYQRLPIPAHRSRTIGVAVAGIASSAMGLIYQGVIEYSYSLPWWVPFVAAIVVLTVLIALRYVTDQPIETTIHLPNPMVRTAAAFGIKRRE